MSDRMPYEFTTPGILSSIPEDLLSLQEKQCVFDYLKVHELFIACQSEVEQIREKIKACDKTDEKMLHRLRKELQAKDDQATRWLREENKLEASQAIQNILAKARNGQYKTQGNLFQSKYDRMRSRTVWANRADLSKKITERSLSPYERKKEFCTKKKTLAEIENEIFITTKELRLLRERIDQMGLCWFGEKRKRKAALEMEFAGLQSLLETLNRLRSERSLPKKEATINTPTKSNANKLAEAVAAAPSAFFKQSECEFLCHSQLTEIDSAIFACFVVRAICLGNSSTQQKARTFSDDFVGSFIQYIQKLYPQSKPQPFRQMFENRTSFYDRIFMSKEGIESKLSAVIEEFEIIIKTDVVKDGYVDFSETSPLPILSNGFDGDVKCRQEVGSFFNTLLELLSPHLQNVIKELQ